MKNSSSNKPRTYRNYADKKLPSKRQSKRSPMKYVALLILLAVVISIPVMAFVHTRDANANKLAATTTSKKATVATTTVVKPSATPTVKTTVTPTPTPNQCANNALPKLLLTSISARHLWACDGTTLVYQTAVVTGDMNIVADATPVGSFNIYAKETNLHLIGSDSRGSWNDPVSYWMPFLSNQYGVFGLHDATWRAPTDFGNISPYSDNSSHGCIELPLAAAAWIYNWSDVGTTVTIES